MFFWSIYYIHRIVPITIRWKELGINSIVIAVITLGIILVKDKLFILEDNFRAQNTIYMASIIIIYYSILTLTNYKDVRIIIHQIKKITK